MKKQTSVTVIGVSHWRSFRLSFNKWTDRRVPFVAGTESSLPSKHAPGSVVDRGEWVMEWASVRSAHSLLPDLIFRGIIRLHWVGEKPNAARDLARYNAFVYT